METILALGTTLVSLYLANATNWTLFNAKVKRGSKTVDVVDRTYEQRYTNLAQAAMTGVVCARPLIGVGKIPNATLDGLFLFMALSSLPGNELWDRVKLVVCEKRLRESPKDCSPSPSSSSSPIAMTFPLFIAALVYIRTKILPKYYGPRCSSSSHRSTSRRRGPVQHPSTHNLLALEAEMRAIEGEARALESARAARSRSAARAATFASDDDDAKATRPRASAASRATT
ncbi:inorganic anion exchanger [Aureococcus anophagefferens]|nr:inorganic anion exchanger [Aureococcus anophagefferens]